MMEYPMKAYVADDDPCVRLAITFLLESLDYDVEAFASGEELLTHTRANPAVQLVVTDYNMPGMNGVEVLRQLRGDDALKSIPVVVHTGTLEAARIRNEVEKLGGLFAMKPGPPSLADALNTLKR
jgi:two-component system chemotaxis response regulator CheY